MHRKHVINTLKKHLKGRFVKRWEMPTSFCMIPVITINPGGVYSVYVGLTKLKIHFWQGGQFVIDVKDLDTLVISKDNIVINDSITFNIKGTVWVPKI